jgi:hypothetical protein
MIAEEIRQLSPNRRELRKFGLVVGGVFGALGLLLLARGRTSAPWFLVPGAVLVFFGALGPRVLKPVYLVWMSLAIVLGFVVSQVILTLVFFLVFAPLGLVARCAGRDFLTRKLDRQAATYWMPREYRGRRSPADYERQF